jgi:hypothetical protein
MRPVLFAAIIMAAPLITGGALRSYRPADAAGAKPRVYARLEGSSGGVTWTCYTLTSLGAKSIGWIIDSNDPLQLSHDTGTAHVTGQTTRGRLVTMTADAAGMPVILQHFLLTQAALWTLTKVRNLRGQTVNIPEDAYVRVPYSTCSRWLRNT